MCRKLGDCIEDMLIVEVIDDHILYRSHYFNLHTYITF